MAFGQFLNQWWNLPYLVMLGLVGVFFLLQAIGMVAHASEHDLDGAPGEAEGDIDSALGHYGAHDATADAGADGSGADHPGGDSEADPPGGDSDAEHPGGDSGDGDDASGYPKGVLQDDAGGGSAHPQTVAGFLGVGRVPFMVVWLTLFIFTSFTGLFLNRVLQVRTGAYQPWFFPLSLLASLAVGVGSVRFAATGIGKLVDVGGRGASARRELRGALGVVASPVLDCQFGEVRVHDPRGNELIVHGHVAEGDAALRQGDRVVLIELENESGLFQVAAFKE